MDEVQALSEVCRSLLSGDDRVGASLLKEQVPFVAVAREQRKYYSRTESVGLFLRDRFTDATLVKS
jgi:hypothetical protein